MDSTLRNNIVLRNLGLVHRVVRALGIGTDYDDCVQAGTVGLIKAVDAYEPTKGKFIPFAKWRILHEVQECVRKRHGKSYRIGSRGSSASHDDFLDFAILHPSGGLSLAPCDAERKTSRGPRFDPTVEPDVAATDAAHDIATALAGALATPAEAEALLATADGAGPVEVARGLALNLRDAGEAVAEAFERVRDWIYDGDD